MVVYTVCVCYAVRYFLQFARIFSVCSVERKNFSGTSVSKMSDKEHSLPVLGYAVIFAVKYLPFDAIPQFRQGLEDNSESSPVFMRQKSFDVFTDKIPRADNFNKSANLKEDIASRVIKTLFFPCDTKGLARESSANNVNCSSCGKLPDFFVCNFRNIMRSPFPFCVVNCFIALQCEFIKLAKADARMPGLFKPKPYTTNTSAEVYKIHVNHPQDSRLVSPFQQFEWLARRKQLF